MYISVIQCLFYCESFDEILYVKEVTFFPNIKWLKSKSTINCMDIQENTFFERSIYSKILGVMLYGVSVNEKYDVHY